MVDPGPEAVREHCPFRYPASGVPCPGELEPHCDAPGCCWSKCTKWPRSHVLNPATGHMMGDKRP